MSLNTLTHSGVKSLQVLRESAAFILAITDGHETIQQVAHALHLSSDQRRVSPDEELRALTVSCNSAIAAFAQLINHYRLQLEAAEQGDCHGA
jgi:hypothetical protein